MVSACYRYSVLLIVKTNMFFLKTNHNFLIYKKQKKKRYYRAISDKQFSTLIYLLIVYLIKSN